jgi:hypothetical protein
VQARCWIFDCCIRRQHCLAMLPLPKLQHFSADTLAKGRSEILVSAAHVAVSLLTEVIYCRCTAPPAFEVQPSGDLLLVRAVLFSTAGPQLVRWLPYGNGIASASDLRRLFYFTCGAWNYREL